MSHPSVTLRRVRVDDAAELAALYARERTFLAPFEPERDEDFFTEPGQRRVLERTVELRVAGALERFLIVVDHSVQGVVAVNNITWGAFQSATLGYFVAQALNGRGVATRAVGLVVEWAFEDTDLHRLEAGTLVHNVASQRVLERNGFTRIGHAPRYLAIAGRWQDHILFQLTREDYSG